MIDAVVQRLPIVILDNSTTAMTGNQPTPASGFGADGTELTIVEIPSVVKGCGVTYCHTASPYDLKHFTTILKEALQHCRKNGPAVVISKYPCILQQRRRAPGETPVKPQVGEKCDGCGYCIQQFECPALIPDATDNNKVSIDTMICSGCGVCVPVCPKGSIQMPD